MTAMDDIRYRCFDQRKEDKENLFRLFEKVYGDSGAIRKRWEWEFFRHPRSGDIAIWLAEAGSQAVGMTVRTPVSLVIDGEARKACFATNSMVDPTFRGKGIIGRLYAEAAEPDVIQLSKGTAEGMYKVLKRMGYRDILPNTYQVCLVAPCKWALGKILGKSFASVSADGDVIAAPFRGIQRFPESFDVFAGKAVAGACGGILKSAEYMNWRYTNVPHRSYRAYIREVDGEIVSAVVLRITGSTAVLVDIFWDGQHPDEPATAVRFARKASRRLGAVKLVAWGNGCTLRRELRRQWFFDNSETPHFSFRYPEGDENAVDWPGIHIVHGDGDAEYL